MLLKNMGIEAIDRGERVSQHTPERPARPVSQSIFLEFVVLLPTVCAAANRPSGRLKPAEKRLAESILSRGKCFSSSTADCSPCRQTSCSS